jgi:hypothetical protein
MALNASFRSNGFWYEEQITEELVLRMAFKQVRTNTMRPPRLSLWRVGRAGRGGVCAFANL